MTHGKGTLAEVKRRVATGVSFDVTNHYITRPDHPCYGTVRRTVLRSNSGAFTLSNGGDPRGSRVPWPKADQVTIEDDGVIRVYGHPQAGDLFLTLTPVD